MPGRSLFQEYGNKHSQRQEDDRLTILEATSKHLVELEEDSVFFSKTPPRSVAHLQPFEIETDQRIGTGEFGIVLEVARISLKPCEHAEETSAPSSSVEDADFRASKYQSKQLREHLANRLYRELKPQDQKFSNQQSFPVSPSSSSANRPLRQRRYAVKQIRKDLYPNRKIEACKDLAKEAKLLGRLQHPNIVKMRATVGRPGEESFAILLDRLGPTLGELVDDWHRRVEDSKAGYLFPWGASFFGSRRAPQRVVLAERILALYDAAQALHFLHKNSIIFRDLKTENVARNHHGAFQLLDFGLAKEVKTRDRWHCSDNFESANRDLSNSEGEESNGRGAMATALPLPSPHLSSSFHQPSLMEDRYRMTGLTGTVRIMSPEALLCQPYGLSADVYSFGILVWEVFRGQRNRLTAAEVTKGQRPELPVRGMPPRVESLVRKCYGAPAFRPTFAMLCQEFEYQLLDLQDQQRLDDATVATTFESYDQSGVLAPAQSFPRAETHTPFLQRADYLRRLSYQSFATIPSSGNFAAVEQ